MPIPVGPFELLAELALGGMGTVWRARYVGPGADALDSTVRDAIAVKVMTRVGAQDTWFRHAFEGEVRAAASLDHPNILPILDQGMLPEGIQKTDPTLIQGSPWFAMPLLAGGTLKERAPMTPMEAFAVLEPLLMALGHAHAHGVIHGDLKPQNVLFDAWGTLKLADFGLAHCFVAGAENKKVVGTPAYMSPEQFLGNFSAVGPWTDLYAVGGVTWYLLTGERLFSNTTSLHGLREAHLTWPVPKLPASVKAPPGLDDWLQTMLAKVPSARYTSSAAAFAALTRALGGKTTNLSEPKLRPHTRLAILGVGAGLVGVRPPPFVGREQERNLMWEALSRVQATGCAEFMLISGDTGVGKSRLGDWLAESAHEFRGVRIHRLGVDGLAGLVRQTAGGGDNMPDTRDFLCRAGAPPHLVGGLLDIISPSQAATLSQAAVHTIHWLQILGQEAVITIGDLETDEVAQALVTAALANPDHLPVLLVAECGYDWCHDSLSGAGVITRLPLSPLKQSDAVALVEGLIGLGAGLATEVAIRTAGNPLFAVQLIHDWVTRGLLIPGGDGFVVQPEATLTLPDGPGEVWRARAEALTSNRADATAIITAAVLGLVVNRTEWARATATTPSSLVQLERRLLDGGLVRQTETGFEFCHAALREALLELAGKNWHRLNANCAASVGPQHLGRYGTHLLEAGDKRKAREPLGRALEAAISRGELGLAGRLTSAHQRAWDNEDGTSPDMHIAAQLIWARLALRCGRIDEARAKLSDMLALPDDRVLPTLRQQLLVEAALAAWRAGDLEEGQELAQASLDIDLGGAQLRARGVEVMARVRTDRGELDAAQALWERAGRHYSSSKDVRGLATCHLGQAWVAICRGEAEVADKHLGVALSICEREGARTLVGVAWNLLGELARVEDDLPLAEKRYRTAREHHLAVGAWAEADTAALNVALVRVTLGEFPVARQMALNASSGLAVRGTHQHQAAAQLLLSICDAAEDAWELFEERLNIAVTLLQDTKRVNLDVASLSVLAADAARDVRPDLAIKGYGLAAKQFRRLGRTVQAQELDTISAEISNTKPAEPPV